MSPYKLKNKDLKDFICISRLQIENKNFLKEEKRDLQKDRRVLIVPLYKNFIETLMEMTAEDKIFWFNLKPSKQMGIVIKKCIFSNYRVGLEKIFIKEKNQKFYRISLYKNLPCGKSTYYTIKIKEKNLGVSKLYEIIEKKILFQYN